jgi:hypothetical protein
MNTKTTTQNSTPSSNFPNLQSECEEGNDTDSSKKYYRDAVIRNGAAFQRQ